MLRNLIVTLCVFTLAMVAHAQKNKKQDTSVQIIQPIRYEFDLSENKNEFLVINGGHTGLVAVQEQEGRSAKGQKWSVYHLDTALVLRWEHEQKVPSGSRLIGYEYNDGHFYMLYNKNEYRMEDLLLIDMDVRSRTFEHIEITTVFPIQVSFFEVLNRHVILAGKANNRSVLMTVDSNDPIPRVVPGFYETKNEILDIVLDDNKGFFTVLQSQKNKHNRHTVSARTYSFRGDLIQENTLQLGEKKNLIDAASTIFSGGYQYLAGAYSNKSLEYSKGLYLGKFVNGRQQFIKYYDYADLNNFFGYMNDKREQRVKERIARQKAKGKKPRFSYRLIVHDMIPRGNEYLMVAEAYYPKYSNEVTGYYRPGGTYSPYFSGYIYTHAVVVAFDKDGEIIWDASFKMDDIETFTLKQHVAVQVKEDQIVLMYLEDHSIRSQIISGDKILEGYTYNPVKLLSQNEEVSDTFAHVEGVEMWYDHALYAYGEQKLYQGSPLNTRQVFYINKVTVGDKPLGGEQ